MLLWCEEHSVMAAGQVQHRSTCCVGYRWMPLVWIVGERVSTLGRNKWPWVCSMSATHRLGTGKSARDTPASGFVHDTAVHRCCMCSCHCALVRVGAPRPIPTRLEPSSAVLLGSPGSPLWGRGRGVIWFWKPYSSPCACRVWTWPSVVSWATEVPFMSGASVQI